MKKFLYILLFIISFVFQSAFAEEVYKITSVNFDTSSAIMYLTVSDDVQGLSGLKIKPVKLQNPNRVYFDLPSAILATPKDDIEFSSGVVKHAVVAQNSTNPAIVRVVLTLDEKFDADKLSFYKLKNSILVKFNGEISKKENYFQNTYREERASDDDYYEYSAMTTQVISKVEKPVSSAQNVNNIPNAALKDIQSAFSSANIPQEIKTAFSDVQVSQVKKNLRLNTRYYLNGITKTANGILLSGFGSVSLEKPLYLSEPARIVYDMPNTLVNKELRNKEYSINPTETVKIGQFEKNKARVVLKTAKPDKYIPIYSVDNEAILLADTEKLNVASLSNIKANLMATFYQKEGEDNSAILAFSAPVVYSIKRSAGNFTLTIYNADKYNEVGFNNALKGSPIKEMQLKGENGLLKITYIPHEKGSIRVFTGMDGKSLKIAVNEPEAQSKPQIFTKKKSSDVKVIVIDPGHGGADAGAVRAGVNEKAINLDVSKRVEALLKAKGYKVYMTRSDDSTVSLQERVDIAEGKDEDIFVSIHVNASERTDVKGIETHFYHDYSRDLADVVHKSMVKYIESTNRGIIKSKFYVINHTTKPAILVEIGFISNPNERQALLSDDRKQKTAKAIAEGVINYFKEFK